MKLRFIFFYTLRNLSRVLFGRNFLFRNNIAKNIYLSFASIVHFFSLDHRKQAKWEIENPDAPWLVPKAVVFIENWLKKEMKGFEFGSGRSTKWFANKTSFYYSIEGDFSWFNKIKNENKINIKNGKCKIIYRDAGNQINIELDKKEKYTNALADFKDSYFDFGLIDGHHRLECLEKSLNKVKNGGILIVDNTDAIDGIKKYFKKYKFSKFSNGISETTIIYKK